MRIMSDISRHHLNHTVSIGGDLAYSMTALGASKKLCYVEPG